MLWNLLLGLIFLGSNRYGVYITDECPQESYSCPKICDVDHIHYPRKECRDAKSREKEIQLYEKRQESSQRLCKEDWQESSSQEEVLIEESDNGKD